MKLATSICLLLTCLVASISSFKKIPLNLSSKLVVSQRKSLVARELFPQVVFAASCAGAVFAYVYFNIEEIKQKQKIAIDAAMTQQSETIKSAQETQRANIERIQKQQADAIRKIAEDAKNRRP